MTLIPPAAPRRPTALRRVRHALPLVWLVAAVPARAEDAPPAPKPDATRLQESQAELNARLTDVVGKRARSPTRWRR
jgi:hypothetical protein